MALSIFPYSSYALAAAATITQLDGTKVEGKLTAWDAKQITLLPANEETAITVAASDLLRVEWDNSADVSSSPESFIAFTDGTRLSHTAFAVQAAKATITIPFAEQPLQFSTKDIRFVELLDRATQKVNIDQEELLRQAGTGDVLAIYSKKTNSIEYLTGLIVSVTPEQVEFDWDGEVVPVRRSKVTALAYYHAKKPPTRKPICILNLNSGTRLSVASLAITQEQIQVTTTNGLKLSVPIVALQNADYSQGKLAYLSDLKPIEQKWTPRITLPTSVELIQQHGLPRRDHSFTNSAISLSWPEDKSTALPERKAYRKGLALRSRTEIRYRMPMGMKRFITLAGIDPETTDQGNVTLEIFADRKSIWQGEIDGDSPPVEINVSVTAARELRIVVDYGQNLDFGDRLHLAEARLSQ